MTGRVCETSKPVLLQGQGWNNSGGASMFISLPETLRGIIYDGDSQPGVRQHIAEEAFDELFSR